MSVSVQQPHREVRVLCLGMSRTGTMSLRAAFSQLGYQGVYHYRVPAIEKPSHSDFWLKALRTKYEEHGTVTRRDFDTVYDDYEVIIDSPSVFFCRELLDAYPDAKVILQTRPMDIWFKSHVANIWSFNDEYYGYTWNPHRVLVQWLRPRGPFWEFSYLQAKYGHGLTSLDEVKQKYVEHNQAVRAECQWRGREYLEYDVAMGWAPLCDFLDKEVADQPFPRLNDTKTFQQEWKPILADVRKNIHRKMVLVGAAIAIGISAIVIKQDVLRTWIKLHW